MPNPTPDQTDVLAANERLSAERDAAVQERDESRAQVLALTLERDGLSARLEVTGTELIARTASVTSLTSERDALAATDRDFNLRLASELAKQGIRSTAVLPPSKTEAGGSDLLGQYSALTDPKAKAQFLTKNAAALKELLVA